MKRFLDFFLKQSIALNITFIALVLFGVGIASRFVPVDQFPNFSLGKFTIRTAYPGASAENVERLVTERIEDSIRDMEGLDYVRSTSLNGMSEVIVQMADDVEYMKLYDEMRIRVLGAQNLLPSINGEPLSPKFFINDVDEWAPVLQINLLHTQESDQLDKRSLVLLTKELRTRLEQIEGVKKVQILGVENQQLDIALLPDKLELYGITFEQVTHALRQSGQLLPGGNVQSANGELSVILDDIAYTKEDVAAVVVRSDSNGSHVRVADLMDWEHSTFTNIFGGFISNYNGQDSTVCKVLKESTANAASVKERCIPIVEDFIKAHKNDHITYSINLDSTLIISDSIDVLKTSLFAACILVVLALFWFLTKASSRVMYIGTGIGVLCGIIAALVPSTLVKAFAIGAFAVYIFYYSRAAVLTITGIVFSFIGSLIVFYIMGYSINEITLLGFVLTIGIIVDDAIIVLENIRRHREKGKHIREATIDGTAEVFWPVCSATMTTLAAFLPMLLMSGAIGQFFSLVPIAVSIALAISLLECLIFMPLHVVDLSRLLGEEEIHEHDEADFKERPGMIGRLHAIYEKALLWNLAHPFKCILGIVIAFFIAIGLVVISTPRVAKDLDITPPMRIKFFPSDTSQLWVHLRMPKGSSLEQTDLCARDVAKTMMARGETVIGNITCVSGLTIDSSYNSVPGNQFSFIIVELASKSIRTFDNPHHLIEDMRKEFEGKYDGTGIQIKIEPKKDGPPIGAPVNVRISGINDKAVELLANDLLAWMKSESKEGGALDGAIDLQHNRELHKERLRFEFDNNKLANFSLTPLQAQNHLAAIFDGAYVGELRRGDEDVPIRVRMSPHASQSISDILNLPITNDNNQRIVRFDDIGSLAVESSPVSLVRTNFERSITITGNLKEGAIYSTHVIQEWYDQHQEQYAGANIAFSGEAESTTRSYATLTLSFGIAIFLIYGILASQFQSYVQPIIIMSNIAFSFIGVVFVMSLFGISANILGPDIIRPERAWFTFQCFMAVIGLAGLVINDAIVLIDFINQRRAEGMELMDALVTAGHQRMRPILMTTITTITGLMPMAIGMPEFSVRWSPFATAFIAGIAVSTTMTLLMIPVFYLLAERLQVLLVELTERYRIWKKNRMAKYAPASTPIAQTNVEPEVSTSTTDGDINQEEN